MKELLAAFAIFVLVGIGVGMYAIGGSELGYRLYARYAPRNEEVRRETFEQSRAFQEGTVRDLENLRLSYAGGSPEQKDAIASVARHRMADVPEYMLTPELRQFRSQIEGGVQ